MKKHMLKRLLGLMLVSSMGIGLMAGCGKTEVNESVQSSPVASSSSEEIKSEPVSTEPEKYEYQTGITLVLGGGQNATDDWSATDVVAKIEEQFDVTLDCQPEAEFNTKFSMALAEDDLKDFYIVTGQNLASVGEYGADGYLLPLNEYMEHMPNLEAFFEAHPDYKAACTAADGNIYTVLTYNENKFELLLRNYIRKDWLENVGMEEPKTIDELYNVLVAFKEQDANGNGDPNDEIPYIFADSYARKANTAVLEGFGIYVQNATARSNGVLAVDETGTVYLADATDNYKAYVTFMHKLWEEGLLYDESYSVKIDAIRSMVKENKVGVVAGCQDVETDMYFAWLSGLTSEWNDTPRSAMGSQIDATPKLMISADTEYPAEICRIIDWFFTEEGANWGQNGDVDIYNPRYKQVMLPGYEDYPVKTIVSEVPDGYENWETHRHKKRVINEGFNFVKTIAPGSNFEAIINGSQDEKDLQQFADEGLDGFAAMMQMKLDEVETVAGYPTLVYAADVADERTALWNDLRAYCKAAETGFITGEVDIETGWAEHLATLEKMKLSRLLEIEQATYDAMFKK